jgi:uracil-DNA glycosylase family 4
VVPSPNCPLCPRLSAFRDNQRTEHRDWFNAPVPSFGTSDARLLIVGLAPGLRGANRTGRPFTGDYAGDLLYATLRCVPPENKPLPAEIRTCNSFLKDQIAKLPRLSAIVALGRIAHDATLTALGEKKSRHPFGHGAQHQIGSFTFFDSYHCSRYNTNTGVLTAEMFEAVFAKVRAAVKQSVT